MKKTGIAAMMLSTAIAVSSIAVPVCAAPGQTAESAQMQEQPQTETEPAKSISDEDFAKLLDFVKEKWDAGEHRDFAVSQSDQVICHPISFFFIVNRQGGVIIVLDSDRSFSDC